ncbi:Plasmodium exported protein, unknown function [Plasmodium vivax]|uniref:Uncharacterized protein n=1 Tax=Plasmodium vivax TaxID=5855 RepID=A0A565A504_PLAVI|nr:Plasmodium exported protein, unknown function [Plasmodium vivax]
MLNKWESRLDICFKRYLSEYEGETEIDKTGLYKNSPYDIGGKRTIIYDDSISTYANLKNRDSIKLKLYKTGYKHRYAKKKGLSKLDCYCEKKLFDKIDDINKVSEKMHNDKKRLIKKILKKHCKGVIILTSILLIGLIIHIYLLEIML